MPTTQVSQLLTYPNGTPVEAVQARISKAYEYRRQSGEYGPTTVQNIVLSDSTGEIRTSVWGHPDLTTHVGKEYVFGGGRGGKGLTVKHGKGDYAGKIELSISKNGTLQVVEVYHASAGTPNTPNPSPANASNQGQVGQERGYGAKTAPVPINGAKVGMALNNAVNLLIALEGPDLNKMTPENVLKAVEKLSVAVIRLSNDLESGKISVDAPVTAPAPTTLAEAKAANLVDKNGVPHTPEGNDEDVPY